MKTLEETIRICEGRLAKPDKSPESRAMEESYLHHLTNLERTVTE